MRMQRVMTAAKMVAFTGDFHTVSYLSVCMMYSSDPD